MAMTEYVDELLAEGLGETATIALTEWCKMHGRRVWLVRWLVNGRSRAPVAVVGLKEDHAEAVRKLVLKVPTVTDGRIEQFEYARHISAVNQAPEFAEAHLSKLVFEPVRVGENSWITFQEVAGKTFEKTEVLTVLLRRMLRIENAPEDPDGVQKITCDPRTFAAACSRVVEGVLRDWAVKPNISSIKETMTVGEFVRLHIAEQLLPGGRLHQPADLHQGNEIQVEGEDRPLPNPFAVAAGRYFDGTSFLKPLVGKTHGDLHTDNALVRVRPSIDIDDFYLIDVALYEKDGPLTRDPVHLVLYIIARTMDRLSALERDALIDVLLDSPDAEADLLPGWLALLVSEVRERCLGWIEDSGFEREWKQQTQLSLAACALMYIGRTSTRDVDKHWFLRLAARALDRFAEENAATVQRAVPAVRSNVADPAQPAAWIGSFCRQLPLMTEAAERLEAEAEAAELERLRMAALGGLDQAEEYRELNRRLGGPAVDERYGTKGSEGRPVEGETYVCPMGGLCDRAERRKPSGPKPMCHLPDGGSRPLTLKFLR
jgi:hypothetical protein